MMQTLNRSLLLLLCLSLPGCLLHSGILTGNVQSAFVSDPAQTLLIAGKTASCGGLQRDIVIDDPIAYGNPVTNTMGDTVSISRAYTNVDGDKLIFTRTVRAGPTGSGKTFEVVKVYPVGGTPYELDRLPGHMADKRAVAYGFYF